MAEDQAAGVPPAAETAILALGAGAAGPEPAAAPGMGMGQGGGGLPPAAAAAAAGRTAAALSPQALIAASPGRGQGADVRCLRRVAAGDPKRPCGPPEAQSVLRAIVRHVTQPLWNYVSPADQNGPMALMDLIFTWGCSWHGKCHAWRQGKAKAER